MSASESHIPPDKMVTIQKVNPFHTHGKRLSLCQWIAVFTCIWHLISNCVYGKAFLWINLFFQNLLVARPIAWQYNSAVGSDGTSVLYRHLRPPALDELHVAQIVSALIGSHLGLGSLFYL